MSARNTPIPELEVLRGRAFSFYPPILNIEHNEWRLLDGTWSEILVHNTKGDREIWVPRRFIGAVSRVEEPVMIVGLNKELEFNAGLLRPLERRVISMPKSAAGPPAVAAEAIPTPAMVSGVRVGDAGDSKMGLFIVGGVVLALALAFVGFQALRPDRVEYQAVLQEDLDLSAQDDYYAVVRKLGKPAADHWREGTDIQYRALSYPDRHLTAILMGVERDKALYIGALNDDWRPVHSVKHAGKGDTRALLGKLERF